MRSWLVNSISDDSKLTNACGCVLVCYNRNAILKVAFRSPVRPAVECQLDGCVNILFANAALYVARFKPVSVCQISTLVYNHVLLQLSELNAHTFLCLQYGNVRVCGDMKTKYFMPFISVSDVLQCFF
jgi:hypothetical protein